VSAAAIAFGVQAAASAAGSASVQPTAASETGTPGSALTPTTAAPVETLTPAPSTTPSSTPTGAASSLPPPTSATPTPSPTASPTPTKKKSAPVATPTATAAGRTGTPAAVEETHISLTTGALAVAALLLAAAALWVAHRVDGRPARGLRAPPLTPAVVGDTPTTVAFLVELGGAMIDSGYTVTQIQVTLRRVLEANGVPDGQVIVMPTALFVSVPGATTVETAVAAAGLHGLRLDQVDAVSRTVVAAETGAITASDGLDALRRARALEPPFGPASRTLGYAVLSTGLALILQGTAADLLVAAALGAGVGALLVMTRDSGTAARAVLPFLCAFLVAVSVFVLGHLHADISVLPALVAPLVTFLPGALLTTGVIELSTGQMISGAGRIATGLLQLVMLALGIAAAAKLVGIAARSLEPPGSAPLGDLGPWVGVALFGAGVLVHHCARRESLGWMILVLYVAYGAQIIGGLFLGSILSAFFGALVMSPVASFVALRPTGPPVQVSFLPAFWLLVPGALGLVGVTQLLGANRADSLDVLVSTGTTMIGISFGVLIGLAVGTAFVGKLGRTEPVSA
jgi:uncharacterized membrane protein YjjP (DUF1212 family)